jgi:predicted metal-dependent peptidase
MITKEQAQLKLNSVLRKLAAPPLDAIHTEILGNVLLAVGVELLDSEEPLAYTDGVKVYVSRGMINELSDKQLGFVLLHEALHVLQGHVPLSKERKYDPHLFNIATDAWINDLLLEIAQTEKTIERPEFGIFVKPEDFGLPKDDKRPRCNRYTEIELYRALTKNSKSQQQPQSCSCSSTSGGSGSGSSNSNNSGNSNGGVGKEIEVELPSGKKVSIPKDIDETSTGEADIEKAKEATEKARHRGRVVREHQRETGRGTGSGGLAEVLDRLLYPPVDWEKLLEDALTTALAKDEEEIKWANPKPYGWSFGVVLPGAGDKELIGPVVFGIDTSGSIGTEELSYFFGAVKNLLEDYDNVVEKVIVIQHDYDVQKTEEFEDFTDLPEQIEAVGRGGTSHKWLEKVIPELLENEQHPSLVILLTDAESDLEQVDWQNKVPVPTVILTTSREPKIDIPWVKTIKLL